MTSGFTLLQLICLLFILCVNVYSVLLFYIDKKRAINNNYRISEKRLLIPIILLGGMGAWIGMIKFRHKTQHLLFKMVVPLSGILTLIAVYFLVTG